jgi:hypothetical protein
MSKNRIIPQMFDVRPVDEAGDLDWKKIKSIGVNEIEKREIEIAENNARQLERETLVRAQALEYKEELRKKAENKRAGDYSYQEFVLAEKQRHEKYQAELLERQAHEDMLLQEEARKIVEYKRMQAELYQNVVISERAAREREQFEFLEKQKEEEFKNETEKKLVAEKIAKAQKRENFKKRWFGAKNSENSFSWRSIFSPPQFAFQMETNNSLKIFSMVALVVFLSIGVVTYASRGVGLKGRVLGASTDGLTNLNLAVGSVAHQNFEESSRQFAEAYANFDQGSKELDGMGGMLLNATRFVPFATKISSGKNAIEAGKHFSTAGKALNNLAQATAGLKKSNDVQSSSNVSLLDVFQSAQENIVIAKKELDAAQENIDLIVIDDLPIEKQSKFLLLKQKLPDLRLAMDFFLNNSHIFADLLGGNGPRKYLFLFQNNSEMRATGGFIGTYGLVDISNGHIKKFFIDGIFNPDGQLREKIVPPFPIQKISANWSMHDSNWFADFPVSAKKAISFYEKTGGPTADGVITLTPTMMKKLLTITGPIEMPEYNVTLDSDNFIELTQNEVEVDYDKQDNRPKKILSDLAPLVLEKLLSSKNIDTISRTAAVLLDGLNEKHILLFSENAEMEKLISKQGWSGEVISAQKDYLSVVNTNINGFKTDAVVDEKIEHQAEIQDDGSIIDTVKITRKHNGGNSNYAWFNKVNADYMRVYVPEGSKLLEVSGQTREIDKSPVDYDALGFKRDADVVAQESGIQVDEKSGTQIFQESGKTVFGNWVYVSPQENVTITYKYVLPFKLFQVAVGNEQPIDSYSLALQKQSGSVGSDFSSIVTYPSDHEVKWNFPESAKKEDNNIKSEFKLDVDRFVGILFVKK